MKLPELLPNFETTDMLLKRIAPKGYVVGLNAVVTTPQIFHCEYDPEWWTEYFTGTYRLLDPLVHWGCFNVGTRRWSEVSTLPEFAGGKIVMNAAKKHGLNYGVLIARKSRAGGMKRSLFSCAREDREFTDAELFDLEKIFHGIADLIEPLALLTVGEKTALEGTARGLTHKEIAAEDGVGGITVNRNLSSARKKLAAKSNSQAVLIAQARGLIETTGPMKW